MVLVLFAMQSTSASIWARIAVPISNNDNYYTTGTTFKKKYTYLSTMYFYSLYIYIYIYIYIYTREREIRNSHFACLYEVWWTFIKILNFLEIFKTDLFKTESLNEDNGAAHQSNLYYKVMTLDISTHYYLFWMLSHQQISAKQDCSS